MTDHIDQRIAKFCASKWMARPNIYRLPCDDVAIVEAIARAEASTTPINWWAARLFLSCRSGAARISDLLAGDRVHVSGARNAVLVAAGDLRTIERASSDGDRLLRRIHYLSRQQGLNFFDAVHWINSVLSADPNQIMVALGRPMSEWDKIHEAT